MYSVRGLSVLLFLSSFSAHSMCYIASDMQGVSVRQVDSFGFDKDGFKGQEFEIRIGNESGGVSNSDLNCFPVGSYTLLCLSTETETKSVIETWAVYPSEGVVLHTKTIHGYGEYNGAQVYKGKLQGLCE